MGMRQLKIGNSITVRESESVTRYLREISKTEMITPQQEVELAQGIRQGDRRSLDRLVNANLRFVVSVAKQYQGHGLGLADLINEGNLGLIKAAQRFDPTKGFRFISFAVWWIRQNILQAIVEQSRLIRLPLNQVSISNRIQKALTQLEQQLERTPSPEELSEVLGITVEEIDRSLGLKNNQLSLDSPLGGDDDVTVLDTLENRNAAPVGRKLDYTESLRGELARAFQLLNDRQKQTLCYFFGIGVDHPLSLDEIADRFCLTRERVRQIKEKALLQLRNAGNSKVLQSYLAA
ncbi:MAG TPA: RNA polymerase sigma factor RpoD/SigA [Chitinophagaceae bacterium]|nr:RNA polymerase sigma factor RpoD/SigA [Chitinophagaceae bacterium]